MHTFETELWVPRTREEVFEFFSRAENLDRITPPWLHFRIAKAPERMERGAIIEYALKVHGLPMRWRSEMEEWNPPHVFIDVQLKGPYKLWRHTHRFTERDGGTLIQDRVEYDLPFGFLGEIVHRLRVKRDVEQIFAYRTRSVRCLF